MDDVTSSNTARKQRGKPFEKGDPRINRKGRPKSFDGLRALAQSIAHEAAMIGDQPVTINDKPITVTEDILRKWAASRDPRLQTLFVEIAYGKVPTATEVSGKLEINGNGEATERILRRMDSLAARLSAQNPASGDSANEAGTGAA